MWWVVVCCNVVVCHTGRVVGGCQRVERSGVLGGCSVSTGMSSGGLLGWGRRGSWGKSKSPCVGRRGACKLCV